MRESAATWLDRIARGRASGASCEEFAAREGVRAKTLQWWVSELRRREKRAGGQKRVRASNRASSFLPVVVREERKAESPVTIELRSGHVIRVISGFDPATLLGVVETIGAAR